MSVSLSYTISQKLEGFFRVSFENRVLSSSLNGVHIEFDKHQVLGNELKIMQSMQMNKLSNDATAVEVQFNYFLMWKWSCAISMQNALFFFCL